MSQSSAQQAAGPLLSRLPSEIRHRIYHFLVCAPYIDNASKDSNGFGPALTPYRLRTVVQETSNAIRPHHGERHLISSTMCIRINSQHRDISDLQICLIRGTGHLLQSKHLPVYYTQKARIAKSRRASSNSRTSSGH